MRPMASRRDRRHLDTWIVLRQAAVLAALSRVSPLSVFHVWPDRWRGPAAFVRRECARLLQPQRAAGPDH